MTPEPTLTDEGKKCVCNFALGGSWYANEICGKPYNGSTNHKEEWCRHKLEDGTDCGHDAACHAQPTNAVTQRGE
jgi:hypothetical protein